MIASPLVVAQQSEVLDEIQVTATRRPAQIGEVSAALTVISSAELERVKLMTDALASKPGVFLQQTTPGQGAAIIRGLKGSEVLHLVDGMRLNNAIFRNAPTQYLALVAPGTLDRIEVVRGAPASLYGSDAVGGVVQALSRMPAIEGGHRGDAFLAFDTADLAKLLRGAVEFGSEDYAALVSGEYLETGNRRIGGGARIGPSGYQSKGGRIALSATPSDAEAWLFDLQFARQPKTPRVDELVPGFGDPEPAAAEFFFAPNERVFAHVRHTREQGWWNATWNFDLGWQRIADDRILRDFQTTIRRYEENQSDLLGFTINANGESGPGNWVAGVEFYHDDVSSTRNEEDTATGATQSVTARFPDGATVDQAAIYGNYSYRLSARQSLTGGLRWSSITTDLPAAGAIAATSARQNDISADVGWTFALTDETRLAANLGYGFRAPNVFDLGTLGERPGNRFNIPNPDLDSEHITQFDVGIRHQSEHIDVDLTVFALQYKDRITSVLTGAVTADGRDVTQSRNLNSADIVGIEFGGRAVLSPELMVDVVLNYLRGDQSGEAGGSSPGDRIPPLNGRLGVAWQATDSVSVETFLVFAAEQDRLSERDSRDRRINPAGTPGWLTTNIRATWTINDAWEVAASVENLFDKRYRVHGSGIDAVGRNLFVSVRSGW